MSRRRMRCAAAALVTLVAVVLAGCTGVPTSSRPQSIQSIGLGEGQSALPIRPERNADPRDIVTHFLEASGLGADRGFSDERRFLSKQGNQGWSPSTATVIADDRSVGTWNPSTSELVVTGRQIGSVSAAGVYTPVLTGTGDGGVRQEFKYKVQLVGGQYRITSASPGLLLTNDQFRSTFQQRDLYYFDTDNQYLVQVLRYSALTQPVRIAEWMLDQLAATSPAPDVQNVVDTNTFPTQARRIQVSQVSTDGSADLHVQITGSAGLSGAARNLLAAQVSQTLDGVLGSESVIIEDGNQAISVPRVQGSQFRASDFAYLRGPPAPAQEVYYLSAPLGRIRTSGGIALAGPLARTGFQSVALARPSAIGELAVAGVQITGNTRTLVIGTQSGGIHATSVRGDLSRPAWAPGRAEVWIAAGSTVYRVTTDGKKSTATTVPVSFPFQAGRISALRLSPDGSRIALVVSGARNSGQVFVGRVLRSGRGVQVGALNPISPEGVFIKDVAWIDSLKLLTIGDVHEPNNAHIFNTLVDGSNWVTGETTGLPSAPDSVTIAPDTHAWVSADNNVWQQGPAGWASPGPSGQTPGVAPIYLG